ncbi:MAG: hypothetical protein QOH91_1148 [Mycobacterium sp.]|nr:hypothetical protein [Mycobacterium sp.]
MRGRAYRYTDLQTRSRVLVLAASRVATARQVTRTAMSISARTYVAGPRPSHQDDIRPAGQLEETLHGWPPTLG